MKTKIAGLLCAIIISISAVGFAQAQTTGQSPQATAGSGLSISPLINNPPLELEPGQNAILTFSIRNVTNTEVRASGSVNDFVAAGETGQPSVIIDESTQSPWSLRDFIGELPSFTLGPLENRDITVPLTVPADANPGSHYGVVRYTANPVNQDDANVLLSASVSSIVLVEVAGDDVEDLRLVQLGAQPRDREGDEDGARSVFLQGDINVFARLENVGNTFEQPYGTIKVSNMFGSTVSEYEFNEERGNVLPDSIRKFEYEVGSTALPGRYTVETNISYGEGGGKIISATTSFWVIPIWLVGLLLIVLVAVAVTVAYLTVRKRMRRSKRR